MEDDIVYSREGERWGHAALIPESGKLCLGQRMMHFRAADDTNPASLMWQLNSDATYRQGQVDTVGATSPHVNVGTIRNFALAQPPQTEQAEIVAWVQEQADEFDDLIDRATDAVQLLMERRSALISAAVTGQIDVRGLAPAQEQAA